MFDVDLNLLFITSMQDKNEPEHQLASFTSECVSTARAAEEGASYLGKWHYLKLLKTLTPEMGVLIDSLEMLGRMLSATVLIQQDAEK